MPENQKLDPLVLPFRGLRAVLAVFQYRVCIQMWNVFTLATLEEMLNHGCGILPVFIISLPNSFENDCENDCEIHLVRMREQFPQNNP